MSARFTMRDEVKGAYSGNPDDDLQDIQNEENARKKAVSGPQLYYASSLFAYTKYIVPIKEACQRTLYRIDTGILAKGTTHRHAREAAGTSF